MREIVASRRYDLTLGQLFVAVLLSRNSAEPTPTQREIDTYAERIENWVSQKNDD
ncbi:hypothetical protein [Paraburkholderia sp. J8-2]|uniref:hypothetical protein n=1 Tax=Paraburkholderia sp. J8-2 TaxID=2805440 RepID=UPI002AB63F5E|nr:hypothetical protein [Paraburkholderia sp. J8-2]